MLSQRLRYLILVTVTVAALAACGGGGTQVAGGGIGGTGISQGSITAFGSVWVNGVEFDTTNAAITRDGAAVTQSDLALGMVVTVDGAINSDGVSGTANSVSYTKELLGPISQKPNDNSLIVLGQTIIIDGLTKIVLVNGSTGTINDLNPDDTVEISGFLTANGIRATYIEVKAPGSVVEYELRGVVTDVNGHVITIGDQAIDVSMVTNYTPTVGDYIEVKATNGTPLVASSVEMESRGLGTGTADQAEFEGYVTSVSSSSDFIVDDQQIQTTAQTIFSGGSAGDIAKGTRLEINGALSNGILVASLISFKDQLTLEGTIDPSSSGYSIFLDTYPGVSIELNDVLTEGISTNSHQIGDYVKIRARKLDPTCTSSCTLLATELDYVSSGSGGSTPIESYADVESVDATKYTITILGKVLDLTSFSSFSGTDSNGNEITNMTQFLNAIKPGDEVHLTGTNTNGAVTWDSIELED